MKRFTITVNKKEKENHRIPANTFSHTSEKPSWQARAVQREPWGRK
jgi:hypothetical protein